MGNLSTWPEAVVGQNWAAQLSLKLKSSPERLTADFVGDPKGVPYFSTTMASKPNSLSLFSLCLSVSKKRIKNIKETEFSIRLNVYYRRSKGMQMFLTSNLHYSKCPALA